MTMDIGTTLRAARQQRGLSLEQLSKRTKISVTALSALERGDLERLPGGIFVRGFLRAYAREVGLDGEDLVEQYLAQCEPEPIPEPRAVEPEEASLGRPTHATRVSGRDVVFTAVVVVLAVSVYLTVREPQPVGTIVDALVPEPVPAAIPVSRELGTAGMETPEPVPAADAAAPADPEPRADGVRLEITATGPCWVSALVDGQPVVYRLLQAGEQQTIEGGAITLRVGDPSTFTYAINGEAGRPLGLPAQVVDVTITTDNYRDFVQ